MKKRRVRIDGERVVEWSQDKRGAWIVSRVTDYGAMTIERVERQDVAAGSTAGVEVVVQARPMVKGNSKRIIKMGDKIALASPPVEVAHEEAMRASLSRLVSSALRESGPMLEVLHEIRTAHAVEVSARFIFEIPSSMRWRRSKVNDIACESVPPFDARKKRVPGDPHAQRPDRGNLLKFYEDVITQKGEHVGLISDDAKITGGSVAKRWGDVDVVRLFVRAFR